MHDVVAQHAFLRSYLAVPWPCSPTSAPLGKGSWAREWGALSLSGPGLVVAAQIWEAKGIGENGPHLGPNSDCCLVSPCCCQAE